MVRRVRRLAFARLDLLLLDELAYVDLDPRGAELLSVVRRTVDLLGEQGFLQYRDLLPPPDE